MKKRLIGLLACLVMAAAILAGCEFSYSSYSEFGEETEILSALSNTKIENKDEVINVLNDTLGMTAATSISQEITNDSGTIKIKSDSDSYVLVVTNNKVTQIETEDGTKVYSFT